MSNVRHCGQGMTSRRSPLKENVSCGEPNPALPASDTANEIWPTSGCSRAKAARVSGSRRGNCGLRRQARPDRRLAEYRRCNPTVPSGLWTLDPGPWTHPSTPHPHDLPRSLSSFPHDHPTLPYPTLHHPRPHCRTSHGSHPSLHMHPSGEWLSSKTGHHPPSYCTSYCTSYSSVWLFSPIHSLEPRYQTQACGAPVLLRTSCTSCTYCTYCTPS